MSHSAAIIDLDGTVYRGTNPLPGAVDAITTLRSTGLDLCFLSNNPTKTRAAYVEQLTEMGIPADESEILSAGLATATYLQQRHADEEIFLIGSPGLREQLVAADLSLTDDPAAGDVLVASWTDEFGYDDMTDALRAIDDDKDTAFIGSDPDRTVPTAAGGEMPGSGAIIGSIEAVTGREADTVLGKPSPWTIDMVRDTIAVPESACLLVGDRLDTDIEMGERTGMTTVLVLTGASTREDVVDATVTPDHVVESLADVPNLL